MVLSLQLETLKSAIWALAAVQATHRQLLQKGDLKGSALQRFPPREKSVFTPRSSDMSDWLEGGRGGEVLPGAVIRYDDENLANRN